MLFSIIPRVNTVNTVTPVVWKCVEFAVFVSRKGNRRSGKGNFRTVITLYEQHQHLHSSVSDARTIGVPHVLQNCQP